MGSKDFKEQIRNAVLNYLNEVNARDGIRNVSKPMNRPTTRHFLKKDRTLDRQKSHNKAMDAVEATRAARADKKKVVDFAKENVRRAATK